VNEHCGICVICKEKEKKNGGNFTDLKFGEPVH